MSDLIAPFSSDADSAVAWYNRSLAKVLGLNPALQTLRVDRLSETKTESENRLIANMIEKRFRRVINGATGAVSIVTTGDTFAEDDVAEDIDPLIAQITRGYLESAQEIISKINPNVCVPGHCLEEIEGLIWHVRGLLDLLITEAPRRGNAFLVLGNLNLLLNAEYGAIVLLKDLIVVDIKKTIETDQALDSLDAAIHALDCFGKTYIKLVKVDEDRAPTLAEISRLISRCADTVSVFADDVMNEFIRYGISDCELQQYRIKLGKNSNITLHEQTFAEITIDEALRALKSEPRRWVKLAPNMTYDQVYAIQKSANILIAVAKNIDSSKIAKQFNLTDVSRASLEVCINRMTGYTISFLSNIIAHNVGSVPKAEADAI